MSETFWPTVPPAGTITKPGPKTQKAPIAEWDEDSLVLGIETSCDETSASVVKGGREILSNVIVSQGELHGEYGGIVPEIAARSHVEALTPAIGEAWKAILLRRPRWRASQISAIPPVASFARRCGSSARTPGWSNTMRHGAWSSSRLTPTGRKVRASERPPECASITWRQASSSSRAIPMTSCSARLKAAIFCCSMVRSTARSLSRAIAACS